MTASRPRPDRRHPPRSLSSRRPERLPAPLLPVLLMLLALPLLAACRLLPEAAESELQGPPGPAIAEAPAASPPESAQASDEDDAEEGTDDEAGADADGDDGADAAPGPIDRVMYWRSQPRDDAACRIVLDRETDELSLAPPGNPRSCPDAFAWLSLLQAIQEEFWLSWSADEFTWPQADFPPDDAVADTTGPYPLCSAPGADPARCCDPDSLENPGYDDPDYPAKHCPYFPGDHRDEPGYEPAWRHGLPQSKAHETVYTSEDDTPVEETGRIIRQEMSETVYRNEPLWRSIFEQGLYHRDGLQASFEAGSESMLDEAPYHRDVAGEVSPSRIEFPMESVMIKSNWIHEDRARALGLDDDSDFPYIKAEILSPVQENEQPEFQPGLHYLLSIHVSTKQLPNWTWATFEHVDNPGRCDYTGCNDSYGYTSPDDSSAGLLDNFTAPKQQSDGLLDAQPIFKRGLTYGSGEPRPALEILMDRLEIGVANAEDEAIPAMEDRGWRSYRLKGSQVDFVDAMGRPTLLGNSITEAGLEQTSSCITCHARASAGPTGFPSIGIEDPILSDIGYVQGSVGIPDPDWFVVPASGPPFLQRLALQTDFVWGVLRAKPLAEEARPDEDGDR